ncbi:MAG: tRNA (guanosine(37)-N1)-methyltransferase TrmD [Corallococcus sp.]|nr:tRNA (guanosine(37)-N1)-methyltransferase TrmD [Corallococcus sp.]
MTMKIDVLTLFPEMFDVFNYSLMGKAMQKGLFEIKCHDIRNYSADKHKKCDDYPFGGGAGMVMTPQPIHDAICNVDPNHSAYRIYMSPRGNTLKQSDVTVLSRKENLLILCGHYEGIDQRVIDMDIDCEISIGDYILSGGEIPAMVLIDTICRYIPDVLGNSQATVEESFSNKLLEYPQYTRPQSFCGYDVPEVLVSGDHRKIDEWRREQSFKITKERRPDLMEDDK